MNYNDLLSTLNQKKREIFNAYDLLFYCISTLVLAIGLIWQYAIIAFLVIVAIYLFTAPVEKCIGTLFYYVLFENVIKIDFTGFALYFVIVAFGIMSIIIKTKDFKYAWTGLIGVIIFIAYITITDFNLLTTVKLAAYYVLVYLIISFTDKKTFQIIIICFICGIIISSILYIFRNSFPRLSTLLEFDNYVYDESSSARLRFSGLAIDPNYYAANIILGLLGIWRLKKLDGIGSYIAIILFTILSIFGFLTFSKMFILMLMAVVICVYFSYFQYNQKKGIIIGAVGVLFIVALTSVFIDYFRIYLNRFLSAFENGFDLNFLFTGRVSIWENYWKAISKSTLNTLIGYGINAGYPTETISITNPIGRAAHNMYLEIWYRIGICGMVLLIIAYCTIVASSTHRRFKKIGSFIPMMIMFLVYATLEYFMNTLFYFHMTMLILFLFDYNVEKKEEGKLKC